MKKIVILFLLLFITGCSSTIKCSYNKKIDDLYISTLENKYKFKNGEVYKVIIKQTINYDSSYISNYNINLNDSKNMYKEMFDKYYSDVKGFKYKISLVNNKLTLKIYCKDNCLKLYAKATTKEDILKEYKLKKDYICK